MIFKTYCSINGSQIVQTETSHFGVYCITVQTLCNSITDSTAQNIQHNQ